MAEEITSPAEFEKEVLSAQGPVLVDFKAAWCGPCKMMSPIVDKLAEEREDIKIVKCDIDQVPSVADQYGVRGVPTFMIFISGEWKATTSGARPVSELEKFIDENI